MPILYSCIVNSRRRIIAEGVEKKFMANYKEYVFEHYNNFEMFGKKTIQLDEKFNLHYHH